MVVAQTLDTTKHDIYRIFLVWTSARAAEFPTTMVVLQANKKDVR